LRGAYRGRKRSLGIIGLLLLGIAIVTYFVTPFSYDRLLMPSRFWVTGAPRACERSKSSQLDPELGEGC